MVDYSKIFKGEIFFFIGFIIIVILNMVIGGSTGEGLISILNDTTSGYELSIIGQVIWFGLIIIYLLIGVVMPIIYIYQGITTDTGGDHVVNILVAILMFIFNMVITFKGWFMIVGISSITSDSFLLAVFWIGFALVWSMITIISPIYIIIQNAGRY